ncbi:MAG: hypothetical protein ACLFV2_11805 [Desulfurivibrionaceae bacterium]
MASVTSRKGKYGTVYRAQVHVKGRRETATFDKKSEAWSWAEETERLLRAGEPLPDEVSEDDMDFLEALKKYVISVGHNKKANTRRLDWEIQSRLARHFQGRTLKGVKPADITSYRDCRLESVGPSSVRQDMSFLLM